MTTFSPVGFSYDGEDKDFEYPTQVLEEPFSDLFDHYLTHTISDLSNHGFEPSDAEFPDFFTDGDTTSSASYATDSASSAPLQPIYNTFQERGRKGDASSLSKTAFVPQNYHSRGRREKLQPAVSGLELLLGIEGRANTKSPSANPPHSAPANLTSLPLRRKPRFSNSKSRDSHDRDHRVCKPSTHPAKEALHMFQSRFSHRIESPQPQEWLRDFDQPDVQAAANPVPLSPPTTGMPQYYDGSPDDFRTPRHMTLREQFFQGENAGEQDSSHMPNLAAMESTLEGLGPEAQRPTTDAQDVTYEGFHEYIQSLQLEPTSTQRQPYPSSSWEPSVSSSSDLTYTLSTTQEPSYWNHGLPETTSKYYSHHHASKSAPALPFPLSSGTSLEYVSAPTEIGDEIHDTQDASMVSPSNLFTTDPDTYQYPPPPTPSSFQLPGREQHSPGRRERSPAATVATPNSRRRSKSAQRRKSASNLKSSKSPISMGFVNFTPSDSKRILTGVAPSGSSKTKARREQEANEKKRKLSAAVLRAVEEAGGDPEPLRKEGLFVD
ncbi:MAG: hypothetical protein LQ341_000799 [Variospora aurantia]|nr:MAG: hypothetical protein LQ341_000799 [Variospora aurantia]